MAIKSPKQKGSGGEYEIIALFTLWGKEAGVPLVLERNLEQVRKGGADVLGVPGLDVEVKRVESNGINSWWAQVCRVSAKTGNIPVLAHRRNRQPWRFRVRAELVIRPSTVIIADVDLELVQMKHWFQHWVYTNRNGETK